MHTHSSHCTRSHAHRTWPAILHAQRSRLSRPLEEYGIRSPLQSFVHEWQHDCLNNHLVSKFQNVKSEAKLSSAKIKQQPRNKIYLKWKNVAVEGKHWRCALLILRGNDLRPILHPATSVPSWLGFTFWRALISTIFTYSQSCETPTLSFFYQHRCVCCGDYC